MIFGMIHSLFDERVRMFFPRKFLAAATSVGLFGVLVAVSPTSVQAADIKFYIHVPQPVLVSTAKVSPHCHMNVTVRGAEGASVAYSKSWIIEPDGSVDSPTINTLLPGDEGQYGIPCAGTAKDLGRQQVKVVAYNKDKKALASKTGYWYLKYNTLITSFNAAPEPVRKGQAITVSGRLHRLHDWDSRYVSYPGKVVKIFFKAKGSSSWTLMAKVKTGDTGKFRKAFTARRDGVWRAYFGGTSRFHKKAADDFVDVR